MLALYVIIKTINTTPGLVNISLDNMTDVNLCNSGITVKTQYLLPKGSGFDPRKGLNFYSNHLLDGVGLPHK